MEMITVTIMKITAIRLKSSMRAQKKSSLAEPKCAEISKFTYQGTLISSGK